MKVFSCNEFTGHYPVGASAVVIAENIEEAVAALQAKLTKVGLKQDIVPEQLDEINLNQPQVIILQDGQY